MLEKLPKAAGLNSFKLLIPKVSVVPAAEFKNTKVTTLDNSITRAQIVKLKFKIKATTITFKILLKSPNFSIPKINLIAK